jgi:hypothetical protein
MVAAAMTIAIVSALRAFAFDEFSKYEWKHRVVEDWTAFLPDDNPGTA